MKNGFRIKITIETPSIDITQWFDLKDFKSPEEWIKAAQDWIKKD